MATKTTKGPAMPAIQPPPIDELRAENPLSTLMFPDTWIAHWREIASRRKRPIDPEWTLREDHYVETMTSVLTRDLVLLLATVHVTEELPQDVRDLIRCARVVCPNVFRVWRLDESNWWLAPSLEEAVADAMRQTGLPRDEVCESPRELKPDELRSLTFTDDDEVRRSFADELTRRRESGPRTELFASREV